MTQNTFCSYGMNSYTLAIGSSEYTIFKILIIFTKLIVFREHFNNALRLLEDHGVVAGDPYIIEKMTTCEAFFLFIGPIKEIIISSWRPCQKREEVDWKLDNKSQPNNGYFLMNNFYFGHWICNSDICWSSARQGNLINFIK